MGKKKCMTLEKHTQDDLETIANEFEKVLYVLINKYCKNGLKKPDLVHKMQYVTKSCELS